MIYGACISHFYARCYSQCAINRVNGLLSEHFLGVLFITVTYIACINSFYGTKMLTGSQFITSLTI